jgi:hypothetical protein
VESDEPQKKEDEYKPPQLSEISEIENNDQDNREKDVVSDHSIDQQNSEEKIDEQIENQSEVMTEVVENPEPKVEEKQPELEVEEKQSEPKVEEKPAAGGIGMMGGGMFAGMSLKK